MKKLFLIFFSFLVFVSCSAEKKVFIVAAAANLQNTAKELAAVFEKKTGIHAELVFSSSGNLTAQITEGAPYSIFLAADLNYPEKLFQAKKTISSPKVYAYGVLAVASVKIKELKNLKEVVLKADKIAIADPKLAPYGREAIRVFTHLGILPGLEDSIIYAENISKAGHYIFSGTVDVGLTALSLVKSYAAGHEVFYEPCPENLYSPIAQGGVVLNYGEEYFPEESKKFFEFIFSPDAKTIFESYGYMLK
ncbi:MAG TPA: molybdate ABC transporter substrate-binding protein [Spirochaetia bacterium]|nr:MAG: molybdate ABC transporter substrate-binding protein [Spirochaetes bacterium GWB1_36_13]HCL56209.1 molybdate ABC transporter substrate-binding protein [Spirochaetia bacterium]